MSNRILEMKLLFIYHLAKLPQSSLASEFYQVQRVQNSGIVAECQGYFEKWNIGDPINYSKYEYKKMIRQKMKNKNLSDLVERAKYLKKRETRKV